MSRSAKLGIVTSLLVLMATVGVLVTTTHGIRLLPRVNDASAGVSAHKLMHNCGSNPQRTLAAMRIGVALGGAVTQAKIVSFEDAAGTKPSIVESYRQFGRAFSWNLACHINLGGALPLIDLDPGHQSMEAIADGHYDAYLRAYAHAVARFRLPVAISFGHEMNGDWYPWSSKWTTPRAFVRAWRHIHDLFVKVGAGNVIWVWTVAPQGVRSTGQHEWWPGSAYVTWVGLDSYYRKPTSNFGTIAGSFSQVRVFTNKPVLITETAVAPGPNAGKQVASLFLGVESHPRIIGFVWFDQNRQEQWRLEGDSRASRMFRREAKAFG